MIIPYFAHKCDRRRIQSVWKTRIHGQESRNHNDYIVRYDLIIFIMHPDRIHEKNGSESSRKCFVCVRWFEVCSIMPENKKVSHSQCSDHCYNELHNCNRITINAIHFLLVSIAYRFPFESHWKSLWIGMNHPSNWFDLQWPAHEKKTHWNWPCKNQKPFRQALLMLFDYFRVYSFA